MRSLLSSLVVPAAGAAVVVLSACGGSAHGGGSAPPPTFDEVIGDNVTRMMAEGQTTFRSDTFGSETFWGDQLRLHQAILGSAQGGVGDGLSPREALSLGLKVDLEALPAPLVADLRGGRVNLDDPATTNALLRLNAVVGLRGVYDGTTLRSVGITCALCHSQVDDEFQPGIGRRRDGWPNRDLNVGEIVLLAPNLQP